MECLGTNNIFPVVEYFLDFILEICYDPNDELMTSLNKATFKVNFPKYFISVHADIHLGSFKNYSFSSKWLKFASSSGVFAKTFGCSS